MDSINSIVKTLPEVFTRQDVLNVGKELGYSHSTANSFNEKAMYRGLIEKTGSGQYKKITPKNS